jgi:CRISPR-associated protein Csd1
MILQALKEYYDRKAADPESDIAPEGFERKEIPFLIVLDSEGRFVSLEDTREQKGRKLVGKAYLLPRSRSRSGSRSYETTFLLWDHWGYLLGHPETDSKSRKQHEAWLSSLDSLPTDLQADVGVGAIRKFYRSDGVKAVMAAPNWANCAALPSCNMTFKLAGDLEPVPCRPAVREHVRHITSEVSPDDESGESDEKTGRCMVTGEMAEIARVHGRTPISKDSKSLVGFQRNSGYDSYGKEQGYNAPVGKGAEFAYVTALNTLLKSTTTRMRVGDATAVFWSAKTTESGFDEFFGELWCDDPDRNTEAVRTLFESPKSGAPPLDSDSTKFYVLGLAPNAARIAVRFWIVSTVAEMAAQVRQHFNDLRIVHGPSDLDSVPLKRLLKSVAVQEDEDNIPPSIAGETMRAILAGLPYPQTLLQAAIRRIRAEKDVSHARAALIKACLNRAIRFTNPTHERELTVSLDITNAAIGYRLGRLFAVLEKIQERANPGINATIRDRFYGAASSTPVTVFGNLMRLKNHHLAKLDHVGERINYEKLIGEIMSGIGDFPTHLALDQQGRFAIGYYHQRQDFFTKKTDKE